MQFLHRDGHGFPRHVRNAAKQMRGNLTQVFATVVSVSPIDEANGDMGKTCVTITKIVRTGEADLVKLGDQLSFPLGFPVKPGDQISLHGNAGTKTAPGSWFYPTSTLDPPKNDRQKQLRFYLDHLEDTSQMAVLESCGNLGGASISELLSLRQSMSKDRQRRIIAKHEDSKDKTHYSDALAGVCWRLLGVCGDQSDVTNILASLDKFSPHQRNDTLLVKLEALVLLDAEKGFDYLDQQWMSDQKRASNSTQPHVKESAETIVKLFYIKTLLGLLWQITPVDVDPAVEKVVPRARLLTTTKKYLNHPMGDDLLISGFGVRVNRTKQWGIVTALESIHAEVPKARRAVRELTALLAKCDVKMGVPQLVIDKAKELNKQFDKAAEEPESN